MIIARQDGQLHVTTQTDHAAFAAELLSLWRTDGLPDNPRRQDLLFATREHDNGWQEIDSAPVCRADGRPHDFLSIPDQRRREIWQRGVNRHGPHQRGGWRPWPTLLIVEHALHLHRRHAEAEPWRDLITGWQELRGELLEESAGDAHDLATDYRLLDAADTLSLAICAGWSDEGEHAGVRYLARLEEDRAELRLDPFPLAGTTSFTLNRRSIEDRPYASGLELGLELAMSRWQRLPIKVLSF